MDLQGIRPQAALVAARAEALQFQSPISFLQAVPIEVQQQYGTGAAGAFGEQPGEEVLSMPDELGQWLLQHLHWDSDYFGTPTYRLFTGLFAEVASREALAGAAQALRQHLAHRGPYYAFCVVPAEDVAMLPALTGGGWQLIETRLNFYCPIAEATLPVPASVRPALPAEASLIGHISATARNPYDRFHADPWFGPARADAFLARYAEAATSGTYADTVLIPDEPGLPIDSFLAIGDTPASLAHGGFSRVLLTAVGPQNRGWHQKLVAETVRRANALGFAHVLMTTQATNRAVFRTCEKLGFRLGSTSHVLACHG